MAGMLWDPLASQGLASTWASAVAAGTGVYRCSRLFWDVADLGRPKAFQSRRVGRTIDWKEYTPSTAKHRRDSLATLINTHEANR